MTHGEVLAAYRALNFLMTKEWPLKTGYALFKLRRELQQIYDFRVEKERQLVEELRAEANEAGVLSFPTEEKRQRWSEAIEKLNAIEANDLEFEPVKLPMDCEIRLAPDIFAALDGFVYMDL